MNIIYDVINENNPNDNFETNSNNSNKDYIKNLFSRLQTTQVSTRYRLPLWRLAQRLGGV